MAFLNIDIGSRYIKITQTKTKKSKVLLEHASILTTPVNAITDGHVYNVQALVDKIKEYMDKNNIKTKHVVLSISSSKIISRELLLPKAKKKNIEQLVKLNAADAFPVSMDDYVLDYQIVDEEESEYGVKYRINMVVAPIYLVKQYVELIQSCQLKLVRVDYTANCLTKLIQKESYLGNYIVLDLGYKTTGIAIFINGVLKFNRHIEYGLSFVLDKLMLVGNMEQKEAEVYLINQGVHNMISNRQDTEILNDAIRDAFEHMFESSLRYINFYKSRHVDITFSHVYLLSGGANISHVTDLIQSVTELEVKQVKTFQTVLLEKNLDLKRPINLFANCIGSCFSTSNLMPKDLLNSSRKKRKAIKITALSGLCLMAIGLTIGLPARSVMTYKKEIANLEGEINTIRSNGLLELKQQYLADHERLIQKKDFLKGIQSSSYYYSDLIRAMESTMPEDVFYLQLKTEGKQINVSGIAKDELILANLLQSIKKIPFITDVYIPGVQYVKGTNEKDTFISFNMSCTIMNEGGPELETKKE